MLLSSLFKKNHLGGEIWYRSLDPVKKQRQNKLRKKNIIVLYIYFLYIRYINKI